jgi:hypothetical protein
MHEGGRMFRPFSASEKEVRASYNRLKDFFVGNNILACIAAVDYISEDSRRMMSSGWRPYKSIHQAMNRVKEEEGR